MSGMEYDSLSFLTGLSVGMQLRGWHIGGGGSGGTGQCTFFPWAVDGSFPFSTPEEYAAYVATIPGEQDSQDGFTWTPSLSDMPTIVAGVPGWGSMAGITLNAENGYSGSRTINGYPWRATAGGGGAAISGGPFASAFRARGNCGLISVTVKIPVSGTYTLLGGTAYLSGHWESQVESFPVSTSYLAGSPMSGAVGGTTVFSVGGTHQYLPSRETTPDSSAYYTVSISIAYPVFRVKPASSVFDGIRASMVSGDLGVLHSGIAVRVFHGYVVDETAGTYTDPATGVARSYAGWTYNYPARRMVLNMGEGNPAVTVTWGDYKMTILEGAAEQVFYYML